MDIDNLYQSSNITNNTNKKQTNNIINNKKNNKEEKINFNKQKNQKDIIFMDIDVNKNMCQGIYFTKSNIALKCNKPAKFCKHNKYMLCEKHKHQNFGC